MRVIAGSAKGRRLNAPKGTATRPALAKVKEAIFNILGPIEGVRILDLFAGSGAIGIEALSRGAEHATFVENHPQALQALRKNLELCGFEKASEVVPLAVSRVLRHLAARKAQFDLIFVDPPYDLALVQPTLEAAEKVLADGGVVIVESSPRETFGDTAGLTVSDRRQYGQTDITFLRLK